MQIVCIDSSARSNFAQNDIMENELRLKTGQLQITGRIIHQIRLLLVNE